MADGTLLDNACEAAALSPESLQEAIDHLATAEPPALALSLSAHGSILWPSNGQNIPLACLIKGDGFYKPSVKLLYHNMLNDQQNKTLQHKLEEWLAQHLRKTIGGLLDLEKTEVKGMARGIAFQIFEHGGVMVRSDVQSLLADMDKEERKILGNLGIKLGAYYIYHRDSLKPAALQTRAALWRAFNEAEARKTPLPQGGNVSMAFPDNGDNAFYRAMGFPVFGKTCVRVDMVERVNSAVFDGAVEGKYIFNPALASTIGVSVEAVQAILHDLGFRYEETTTGEGEAAVTTRAYLVKKKPPKLDDKPKYQKLQKTKHKHQKSLQQGPRAEDVKKTTGYNPFANLAALKKKDDQ